MAKLTWDAFIAKYPGAGQLVSTGTQPKFFKKPSGISPNNQKQWPNIPALIKISIGSNFAGDWANTSFKVQGWTTKNGKRVKSASATAYLFVFSLPADAMITARFLRAPSLSATPSPQPGFASLIKGSEIDMREYGRLISVLGY